jgi:bifunctional non-homologous end joining protein LigD
VAARSIAERIAALRPDDVTTELLKKNRGNRLFLDTNRNGTAQTVVPAYAVRARDGAPVSMPITWEELKNPRLNARSFTIANACRRANNVPDAWRGYAKRARSLNGVIK